MEPIAGVAADNSCYPAYRGLDWSEDLMQLMFELGLLWAAVFAMAYFPGRTLGRLIHRWAPSWYVCLIAAEFVSLLLIEGPVVVQRAST